MRQKNEWVNATAILRSPRHAHGKMRAAAMYSANLKQLYLRAYEIHRRGHPPHPPSLALICLPTTPMSATSTKLCVALLSVLKGDRHSPWERVCLELIMPLLRHRLLERSIHHRCFHCLEVLVQRGRHDHLQRMKVQDWVPTTSLLYSVPALNDVGQSSFGSDLICLDLLCSPSLSLSGKLKKQPLAAWRTSWLKTIKGCTRSWALRPPPVQGQVVSSFVSCSKYEQITGCVSPADWALEFEIVRPRELREKGVRPLSEEVCFISSRPLQEPKKAGGLSLSAGQPATRMSNEGDQNWGPGCVVGF